MLSSSSPSPLKLHLPACSCPCQRSMQGQHKQGASRCEAANHVGVESQHSTQAVHQHRGRPWNGESSHSLRESNDAADSQTLQYSDEYACREGSHTHRVVLKPSLLGSTALLTSLLRSSILILAPTLAAWSGLCIPSIPGGILRQPQQYACYEVSRSGGGCAKRGAMKRFTLRGFGDVLQRGAARALRL